MKIRTQLNFTLFLFVLILIGVVISLIITSQQVGWLLQQEEIVRRIEQGASELSYLSGDYLMNGESQQRTRWESSLALFSEEVSRLEPANPEQQKIIDNLRVSQARMQAVFTDIGANMEKLTQSSNPATVPEFTRASWSRMQVQHQSLSHEISQLSQQLRDEEDRLKQINLLLALIMVGIFGIYLLINHYLIFRRTLSSISELHAGTMIVGSGNLDFAISVKRADEVGELSNAFNRMTANLKQVTTSKANLENEILERKEAEDALQDVNEELQVMSKELRLQNEELRQTQSALEESKERLNFVLDACHIGTWEFDLANHSMTHSAEYDRLFGYIVPRGSWSYEMWLKRVIPEDRDRVDETYKHAIQTQSGWDCEFRILRLDGQVRWIWALGNQRRNSMGVVYSMAGIAQDITERKRAEEQLRYQAAILSNVNDAVVASDAQFRITTWNSAAESLYGWNADEVIGCNGLEFVHTEWPEQDADQMRNTIAEIGRWRGEAIQRRKDGTRFPVEISSIVLHDDAGQVTGYVSVNRDITERKRAEEALRHSKATLLSFYDSAPFMMGIMELDGDKTVTISGNRAMAEFFALRLTELPGKTGLELGNSAEFEQMWVENYRRSQRDGAPIHFDYEYPRASGSCWLSATVAFIGIGATGRPRFSFVIEDVTERKKVEQALRQAQMDLEHAQEVAQIGSWRLDARRNVLTWSDETYRIFGVPMGVPISNETFRESIHPDDRSYVDAQWEASLRGEAYDLEHRIVAAGQVKWVREKAYLEFDDAGELLGGFGITQDITERKFAESQLQAARDELEKRVQERTAELAVVNDELLKEIVERKEIERQLRLQTTAMDAAANGIVITDPKANIQWANPALFQMCGYASDEFLGKSMRIFNSGQQDKDYYRDLWNTILAGKVWQGEMINKRKDGSLYVEEQTITPVRDEQGQIAHFIAIKQDISSRKQAEDELERRNVELQVISSAEHEQRQLADALVKAALVLNRSLNQDEVLRHILEQIRDVIPYQFASITLLDGETFYDASFQGALESPETQYDIKHRFHLKDFPVLKKMVHDKQPALLPDTSQDADWTVVKSLAWSRSFLSAPLLVEKQVIGFVNLFSAQPLFFTQAMCDRLVAFASHAAVAIQNAWLFERVRSGSERLQSLSRRLVEIQENERLYIARELHDEAGQMLTSLMVDLRVLEKDAGQTQLVLEKVAEMETSLNEVFESLHRVAMALRPATLDHLGLVAALHQYVESIGEKHDLKVSFMSEKLRERLPANMETVLYRIAQEALTNVVRHAHATQVDVVLTLRDDKLILIIEDDGTGFDPEKVSDGGHLGLFGMRERTETINGKLVIESTPGKGTTVMVEVEYGDTFIEHRAGTYPISQ